MLRVTRHCLIWSVTLALVIGLIWFTSVRDRGIIITGATLISPERAEPLPHAFVEIRDGHIVAVGPGDASRATRGLRQIDATGRYIIPGLMDGHVHLIGTPGVSQDVVDRLPAATRTHLEQAIREFRTQQPRSYLYFGFTTIVDLNVVDRTVLDFFTSTPAHPDLFDCDGALAMANGYPMFFDPPETRFQRTRNFLYDPRQADAIPDTIDPAQHTPTAAVARVKAAGGICTKTHHEDGFGPHLNDWPVPTLPMLRDVVAQSHQAGLTTVMHANSLVAQQFAVDAGIDIIAHGMWHWDGYSSTNDQLPPTIRTLLDQIIAAEIGYMPTFRVIAGMCDMYRPAYAQQDDVQLAIPASLRWWMEQPEGRWFADMLLAEEGLQEGAAMCKLIQASLQRIRDVTQYMHTHGGRLLFGSDTPANPGYGNLPGLNGYLELVAWHEAGIDLASIFRAATLDTAKAFRLDHAYGSIEPGKVANLLLLDADPLATIRAYDQIHDVILHGRIMSRSTLAADVNMHH